MHTEQHFNDEVKAVAAAVTAIVTTLSAYVGLPSYITPESISLVAGLVSAAGAVYYYLRGRAAKDASTTPTA